MKYLLALLALLSVSTCHAVVSIESSIRTADNSTSVTSTSSPVNVGASNDLLIVFVGAFDTTYANTVINSVTYNAVGLTLLQNEDDPVTTRRLATYYMFNPPTGANTLTVTWAGAALGGHVHAVVLTGTPTTAFIDATTGTVTASGASFSVSTATSNNGAMTFSFTSTGANVLSSQGSGQTTLRRATNNFWWSSYTQPATSGATTHVYSASATDKGIMLSVSVDSLVSPSFAATKPSRMGRYE